LLHFLQLATKLLLAENLQSEQCRLQTEHQLLLECCEGLQLLKQTNSAQGDTADAAAAGAAAGYAAEELALLQQLQVRLEQLLYTLVCVATQTNTAATAAVRQQLAGAAPRSAC
jgi:hypothetical protein